MNGAFSRRRKLLPRWTACKGEQEPKQSRGHGAPNIKGSFAGQSEVVNELRVVCSPEVN